MFYAQNTQYENMIIEWVLDEREKSVMYKSSGLKIYNEPGWKMNLDANEYWGFSPVGQGNWIFQHFSSKHAHSSSCPTSSLKDSSHNFTYQLRHARKYFFSMYNNHSLKLLHQVKHCYLFYFFYSIKFVSHYSVIYFSREYSFPAIHKLNKDFMERKCSFVNYLFIYCRAFIGNSNSLNAII